MFTKKWMAAFDSPSARELHINIKKIVFSFEAFFDKTTLAFLKTLQWMASRVANRTNLTSWVHPLYERFCGRVLVCWLRKTNSCKNWSWSRTTIKHVTRDGHLSLLLNFVQRSLIRYSKAGTERYSKADPLFQPAAAVTCPKSFITHNGKHV